MGKSIRSKEAIKTELINRGLWSDAVRRREAIKAALVKDGCEPVAAAARAWEAIEEEYLNGGVSEFEPSLVIEDKWFKDSPPTAPRVKDPKDVVVPGTNRVVDVLRGTDEVERLTKWGVTSGELKRILSELKLKEGNDYREDVDWVYRHIGIDFDMVDLRGAPSSGAIGLLEWAKTVGVKEFYTMWAKLLPTKSDDDGSRFSDDGRRVLGTLDSILSAYMKMQGENSANREG